MKDYIMKNKTIFKPSGEKITNFNDLSIALHWIKDHGTNDTMNMLMYAIKDRRTALAKEAKASISVGSTVGVNARTEYWLGTVTKVMKTRCAVKNQNNGMNYTVPMSLIDVKEVA